MKNNFTHKKYRSLILILTTIFLSFISTAECSAHVFEIRVNQAQDGALTWYLISYHGANECPKNAAGLTINGVKYPISKIVSGDARPLSKNIFASNLQCNYANPGYPGYVSYAIVNTPFLGTKLSVQPYSDGYCFGFCVGGTGSFNPPPPPVCSTCPIINWSNTVASASDINGTPCIATDDHTEATISVKHLTCANITADKQFRVIFDPGTKNISYGPFNYASGDVTSVKIRIPYGTSNNTLVKVIDDDFPCDVTHNLSIPSGIYTGVKDTIVPVITPVADMIVNTDPGICGAFVHPGVPTATDNCPIGVPTATRSDNLSFDAIYPVGTTTIIWNVSDANGNAALPVTQTVTVMDNQDPAITPPADLIVKADNGSCAATQVNLGMPPTTDNCGVASVTNNAPSSFPLGETKVIWTVTDVHGRSSTATQIITVSDTQKPTIIAPFAVTAATNVGCTATGVNLGTPITADNCLVASVTNNAPSIFPLGITTVTWKVTDGSGNTATATQLVTIKDVASPVITLIGSGASPDVLQVPNHKMYDIAINYISSDNCSGMCEISKITSNEPINALGDGNTTSDWVIVDKQHVRLRAERSGKGEGRIYTISITCTDPSGNKSTKDVTVLVPKNKAANNGTAGTAKNPAKGPIFEPKIVSKPKVHVYPIPANGELFVRLGDLKSSKAEVFIMNSNGEIVAKKAVQMKDYGSILNFNVSKLPTGIYMVKVVSDGGVQTEKVIVQR